MKIFLSIENNAIDASLVQSIDNQDELINQISNPLQLHEQAYNDAQKLTLAIAHALITFYDTIRTKRFDIISDNPVIMEIDWFNFITNNAWMYGLSYMAYYLPRNN